MCDLLTLRTVGWRSACAIGLFLTAVGVRPACGQTVVLQQPILQRFHVNTVVSVPDRGAVLLGSVSRAEDVRSRTYPGSVGSTVSRRVSHSGLSVHVVIHDFAAMDAALLGAHGHEPMGDRDALLSRIAADNPQAARAARQLLDQHRERSIRPHAADDSPVSNTSRFASFSFK